MVISEQRAVIDFLTSPATHGGLPVERIDTHASIVILAGARAFKLKRAVKYDYLDFSTVDRRRRCCEAELEINKRSAPNLYIGVVPVTRRTDGSFALDGEGTPIDWLVEMKRFDQENLFDRLAARGALDVTLMPSLAKAIAWLHASATPRRDHGGRAGMQWVVHGNARGFAEFARDVLDPDIWVRVTDKALNEIDRHAGLLELRRAGGLVRHCHGDLHLRNIVLLDGEPTLFDGVEFNDKIACTDVLYDLAFLLMDLWKRGLRRHANVVWNAYLSESGDHSGLCLLPLFLSCRAAVRAKTSATAAHLESDSQRKRELETLAAEYLSMAEGFLHLPSPSVVAVGGFSGSGKSTLAMALAPGIGAIPGAIVLRSDELRKRLFGVSSLDRLGPEAYRSDVSRRVYGALAELAAAIVRSGFSVIADAVYARPSDRQEIEQIAAAASVPFTGLWLDAPEQVLVDRTARRIADVSDAGADVVHAQLVQGAGAVDWHRIDATSAADAVLGGACEFIQRQREKFLTKVVAASSRA
jgi:aminoglycoside phosphotransferase family enzyme/predicted kinase